MAEERIDIVVSQKGATEVKRDLESLGQGARDSSPAVTALRAAIEAVSSTADKLRSAMGGAATPVRELKRLVDDLTKAMSTAAGTNFAAQISAPVASTGALSAAAIRAAGGVKALGDGFLMLTGTIGTALVPIATTGTALATLAVGATAAGVATGTALVPVLALGTALATVGTSTALVRTNVASMATSIVSSSTALSTMTLSVAELSRRLVALGYLLAMLRDRFSQLQVGGSGPKLLTDFAANARDITPAMQPATQALITFQGAAQNTGSTLGGFFASAVGRLQGLWGSFTQGIRGAWTAITGLGGGAGGAVPPINNLAAGAAAAGGAAGGATPQVNGLTTSFFSLWRALLALTIIRQIWREITGAIDAWTLMSNKLRQVSTDADNLVASQNAVYESAQRTRSGMDEIATLYTRTAMATKNLGLSQREVMDITETVAMAMKLNGGTTQEAANAMRQLSQAFNKGKLDGDEFRSIMENAPQLQKAFAQGLGVSTAELMRMSKAGELTLPKLIDSLQKAGPGIRAAFGESLPTIAEGFTYLGNSVTKFLGELNQATGFSQSFYNAMKFIGDNLGVLGVALAAVGAAVLVAFGPAAISAVVGFGAAVMLALGPIGWIAGAIAAVVAAIYVWGDSWKVTADGITVLDYIRAALQVVGEYVGIVGKFIGDAFFSAWQWVTDTWGTISSYFGGKLDDVGGLMQTAVGYYIGTWIGLYNGIVAAFQGLPPALLAVMQLAMNGMIQIVQDGLNGIIGSINAVLTYVNLDPIANIDLSGFKSEVNSAALDVGSKVTGAFQEGLDQGKAVVDGAVSGIGAAADALTDRARQISEERRKLEANQPQLSTAPGVNTYSPDPSGKGAKDAEKLQNQLNSLLKTIDPTISAQEKLRQGTEILDKAYAAGLITLDRRNDLLARLKEHLRDQLDPLGKLNADMEKEANLLRLSNDEREIQKKLLEDIEKLRKAGVNLSPIEQKQLEENIRGLERMKEQSKLLGDVLTRVFKGAEDAFIEFIETGKVNFSSLIKSMISDIARLAFQSFVTKPLTNMFQNVLGGLLGGIGGGTGGGGFLSGLFGGGGGAGAALPSLYATGGDFTVGGAGGVDSQMVQFRASPGERVSVSRAGSESNGGNSPQIVFNIQTQDANSFRASEAQIAARMARLASRGNRNM